MTTRTKQMDTKKLNPYEGTSRTHSDEQIGKIKNSIEEFGFLVPVVMADGVILAGHARVAAAKELGLAKVPCIDASHLSAAQRRAYVIADNRLAEDGGWDDLALRKELHALATESFDLSLTGMENDEIAKFVKLDSDYQPTLNPEAGGVDVTDEDINKAGAGMDSHYADRSEQRLIDVTCPHCTKDFKVSADAMK